MTSWLVLSGLAGGLGLSLLDDTQPSLAARLAAALALGAAVVGLAGYPLAAAFGMGDGVRAAAGAVAALPSLVLLRPTPRQRVRVHAAAAWSAARDWARLRDRRGLGLALLAVLGCLALAGVMRSAVAEEPGGAIVTHVAHNYGDLPFHIGIVQSFAIGNNHPPQHPELAGVRLTYPFLIDFLAALAVGSGPDAATGRRLVPVLAAQSIGLACALLLLVYRWTRELGGDRVAGALTPALVFFSGGLGFWRLGADRAAAGVGWAEFLARVPVDYTIRNDSALRLGNLLTTLLIPQRSLLLGLPLFVLAACLVWRGLAEAPDEPRGRHRLLLAGGVAALMPVAHAHSFAVLVASAGLWSALFWRPRAWAGFFAVALGGGLPQLLWLVSGGGVSAGRFLAWQPGWEHAELGIVRFWLINAGLFLPLLLVAVAWRGDAAPVPARVVRFWLPFGLWFVVPNLLRLSPWMWDNIKVLLYWWLGSAPLVAMLVARWLRNRRSAPLGVAFVVVLIASGGLDVWRAASGVVRLGIFEPDGRAFAARLAGAVPTGAAVLIDPIHDHPLLLSGRPAWLGYEGHIWSQGLDATGRRGVVERIYAGRQESLDLARDNGIGFVVVGPPERRDFPVGPALTGRLREIETLGGWSLYAVPDRRGDGR